MARNEEAARWAALIAAHAEGDEALSLALAHVIRNNLKARGAGFLPAFEAMLGAPSGRVPDLRARVAGMCALARAFQGSAPDPTKGALYLHRHDAAPVWAKGLAATALIGPYLFLAAPEKETRPGCAPGAPGAPGAAPHAAPAAIHP